MSCTIFQLFSTFGIPKIFQFENGVAG